MILFTTLHMVERKPVHSSFFEPLPQTVRPPDCIPSLSSQLAAAAPEVPIPQEAVAEVAAATPELGRVKVVGNLGTVPQFQTLASGNLRVKFALSEHHADGSTTWHRVYAVDKPDSKKQYASRIQAKGLEKGMLVEVTGARQVRTVQKNGKPKQVAQIFCYGVRIVGGTTTEA